MIHQMERIIVKTVGKTPGFDGAFVLLEIMMTAAGYARETDLLDYFCEELG